MAEGTESQFPAGSEHSISELRNRIKSQLPIAESTQKKSSLYRAVQALDEAIRPNFDKPLARQRINIAAELTRKQLEGERIATIDHLTGLTNRKFFEEHVKRVLSQVDRNAEELGHRFAIIDIDNFGMYNKVFGETVGDETLRKVSSSMSDATRSSDVVSRWGGEEFVMSLQHSADSSFTMEDSTKQYDSSRDVVERVRTAIENHPVTFNHNNQIRQEKITASIGTTEYIPGETFEQHFERGQLGLRMAKLLESGQKNRVIDVKATSGGYLLHDLATHKKYTYTLSPDGVEILQDTTEKTQFHVVTTPERKQKLEIIPTSLTSN